MGSWGVKALESDNGLDLIFLLKTDYLPKHKKLTLGGLISFLKGPRKSTGCTLQVFPGHIVGPFLFSILSS